MNNETDIPKWAEAWHGDWRDLVPRINEIGNDADVADRLFSSRQEAFNIGVAVGSNRRDLELRALEAMQTERDTFRMEMLGWLKELAEGYESRGQLPTEPPD